jgi:hypothetical protein
VFRVTPFADEKGGVLVMVTIWLPVLVLFVMFVLETGNWFVHERHLQAQADAAAFAGGAMFGDCFASSGGGDDAIFNEASKYAGQAGSFQGASYGSALHNEQIGNANRGSVSVLYQSKTFAATSPAPDDTETEGPCSTPSLMFDVKATEADLPLFFGNFIPGLSSATINAHARVQLRQVRIGHGALPLAVPDVTPKQVAATFIDEATGSELNGCSGPGLIGGTGCSFQLSKSGTSNGLNLWSGPATVSLPAAPKSIGVRIGLGAQVTSCAGSTGSTTSTCYDAGQTGRGLVQIRDYETGGSAVQPNKPKLLGVWPTSACSGSPFFSDTFGQGSCAVGVQATVDFGTGATNPTNAKAAGGVRAQLTATINGQTVDLSPVTHDAGTNSWLWSTTAFPATVPIAAAGGTSVYPIEIEWEEQEGTVGGDICKTSGNKCKDTFGTVQRFMSATDDDDGPVKLVQLEEPASGIAPYSLQQGAHDLTLTVGLKGDLTVSNPPELTALRLTGGSRTSGVNCDGTGNNDFTNAIVNGCKTPYQVNDSRVCPDPAPPNGPADCVPLKTGNLGTTVAKALDDRFAGCPINHWPSYQTGDPRIVQLMVTDFSALGGSGSGEVPVVNFASFYVIGWSGSKCPGNDAWPYPYPEPNGGNIWGYFIKHVNTQDTGGTEVCDPNSVAPCVPVMTR